MEVIITKMFLYDHEIPVPEGLSELLNRAGAGKCAESNKQLIANNNLTDYKSRVVMENGKLRTYLTYNKSSLSTEEKIS